MTRPRAELTISTSRYPRKVHMVRSIGRDATICHCGIAIRYLGPVATHARVITCERCLARVVAK